MFRVPRRQKRDLSYVGNKLVNGKGGTNVFQKQGEDACSLDHLRKERDGPCAEGYWLEERNLREWVVYLDRDEENQSYGGEKRAPL